MGDSDHDYGSFTVNHHGVVNVLAVLAWMRTNVASPHEILVTGSSAGAYGSIAWTPPRMIRMICLLAARNAATSW